jgi:thiol-disulfide isomerase/thioredoxin
MEHGDAMRAHPLLLASVLAGASGYFAAARAEDLPVRGEAPSFDGANAWLNSPPLTSAELRGKVVLVEFWTYTCINWRRTLPYVRAWADKYKDHGLVVIGVHTPEFDFERDVDNVRQAVQEIGIGYPVAIDSDRKIWRAFENEVWPSLFFVDAKGRIRHVQLGEGNYEQSERIIQRLLVESGADGFDQGLVSVDARGAEAPANWGSLRSPESYLRYGDARRLASPGGASLDEPRVYAAPTRLPLNEWALAGEWTVREDASALGKAKGRIAFRFHARDLHLVMGPAAPGTSVRFRVLIDGRPPGAAHGVDADLEGGGTASEPRMYQLIRQTGPITDRKFEIEFLDPGVEAFVFTFG